HLLTYVSRIVLTGILLTGVAPSALSAQDTAPAPATQEAEQAAQATGFMATTDRYVGVVNGWISAVFFADVLFWDQEHELPLVVLWRILGATYLTLRMGFINFRAFRHSIDVVRGKYSDPADEGEVSHFQALAAALSATVGLGNIAGV